jgi:hypothetical protein
MPTATGTAKTPSVLLNAINTLMVANGWTKLRGETDLACASPKAARYWRVQGWSGDYNYTGLRQLEFRATVGGANIATNPANYTINSLGTGDASGVIAGGANVRTLDEGPQDFVWVLQYDFGSATTVREVAITGDSSSGYSFDYLYIQWSNDGITWTTMYRAEGLAFGSSETKIFSFDDTYIDGRHVSATEPTRSGAAEDIPNNNTGILQYADFSEDVFGWQGPGYDASRRVYIYARGNRRENDGTAEIEFGFSTSFDSNLAFRDQAGIYTSLKTHILDSNEVTYWLYLNSKRLIIVTRSGTQDYTSTYIGFLSAFATPANYPFPLAILTTAPNRNSYNSVSSNCRLSSCADPGTGAAVVRLWDGTFVTPQNRPDSSYTNLYNGTPPAWVWPYHTGSSQSRNDWPNSWSGDYIDYYSQHAFDYMVQTAQGEIPLFQCTVQDNTYLNIGALDGVFAVPGAGVLSPTQVLTIGAVNYRVFPNRTRRNGVNWFAVRED